MSLSAQIKQVKDYLTYRRLPVSLKEEVRKYYYHRYHGHLFNEEGILNELSHPLREVRLNLIANSPLCSLFTYSESSAITARIW